MDEGSFILTCREGCKGWKLRLSRSPSPACTFVPANYASNLLNC
jgi:hypothetical protein